MNIGYVFLENNNFVLLMNLYIASDHINSTTIFINLYRIEIFSVFVLSNKGQTGPSLQSSSLLNLSGSQYGWMRNGWIHHCTSP